MRRAGKTPKKSVDSRFARSDLWIRRDCVRNWGGGNESSWRCPRKLCVCVEKSHCWNTGKSLPRKAFSRCLRCGWLLKKKSRFSENVLPDARTLSPCVGKREDRKIRLFAFVPQRMGAPALRKATGEMRRASPETRREFWEAKFARNVERDERSRKELRRLGWRVIVVWECRVKEILAHPERLARAVAGPSRRRFIEL